MAKHTLRRQSKRNPISNAPTRELRKLSPSENVRAGYSRKAERYVMRDKRVTKAAATISKRQFLQRQTAEHTGRGKIPLERAARLRREGDLGYRSAASEEQASKQRIVRAVERIKKLQTVHNRNPNRDGAAYRPRYRDRYEDLARRKLAGNHIEDGEWQDMMDMAEDGRDPRLNDLRRSPVVTRAD